MKKQYVTAAIFSEEDVKSDFAGCIITAINDYDEAAILVESQHGIEHIADILCVSGNGQFKIELRANIAERYGIEAETSEALINIALAVKCHTKMSFEDSLKIAKIINEQYKISRK